MIWLGLGRYFLFLKEKGRNWCVDKRGGGGGIEIINVFVFHTSYLLINLLFTYVYI